MSNQYPGGIITKNPATPTGPFDTGAAPGIWTITQQAGYKQQGVWPTAGLSPNYIEDVFSTYLYTGTGAAMTINNGIDLSTKGGLVWVKSRSNTDDHGLFDTSRGQAVIYSNLTSAQDSGSGYFTSFNSNGFTLPSTTYWVNSGYTYTSWSFREQPKFFDVVTWTGTGSNRTIAHALGAVPGCIMVKRTDTTGAWQVYHRSLANTEYLVLNSTAAKATGATRWNSTTPTSTVFSLGTDATVNSSASGATYVAYLFAHDAGGFGLTGTDNVISCGSYTGNGSTQQDITLGYEPQWLMIKRTDTSDQWLIVDNMRGFFQTADDALCANTSTSEGGDVSVSGAMQPIATGFHLYNANSSVNASGGTYIYIAIRRGPMKVPTTGTSVFSPQLQSPPGGAYTLAANSGFPIDMLISRRPASTESCFTFTRLQGNEYLATASTAAAGSFTYGWDNMAGVRAAWDASASTVSLAFRRAPSAFDVVCYTGNIQPVKNHNLNAVPELVIIKQRNTAAHWYVKHKDISNLGRFTTDSFWENSNIIDSLTATTFSVDAVLNNTSPGQTYVAYLFATCAGVSKVGSYSGNTGATVTVPCGFTSGVRFVLIKRVDPVGTYDPSVGAWYVWDSARGIVAGNDPYLLLNSTAAEVTNTDYVDTYSAGFEVTSTAPAALNATGGTYIFLAIA